jgi:hypothetical protein
MWENTVERGRTQMTIWRMHIACWVTQATDTHSEYVILTAFPLQQKLHERASMVRYTHFARLVIVISLFILLRLFGLVLLFYFRVLVPDL